MCQISQNWHCGFADEEFYNLSKNYYKFANISSRRKVWFYICTKLNPLYQRILCVMFCLIWPSGSRKKFKIRSVYRQTMNKVHSGTRFVQGLYPNLIESPAFPNDSELDPVQDKTVDLLLHEDGHLSRFFQQVLCRHHDLRVRPWGGDHLHQGSVEWRICLKQSTNWKMSSMSQ